MFTFNVPIAKLNITIPVTVPTEEQRDLHAAHGLKQRLNDTTASIKRGDFRTDGEYHEACAVAVDKVRVKIEAGTVGTRVAAPTKVDKVKVVEFVKAMSDDEFAVLLAAFESVRKAA
jgi:hypothetical protein